LARLSSATSADSDLSSPDKLAGPLSPQLLRAAADAAAPATRPVLPDCTRGSDMGAAEFQTDFALVEAWLKRLGFEGLVSVFLYGQITW
jgi:hypothetical protein